MIFFKKNSFGGGYYYYYIFRVEFFLKKISQAWIFLYIHKLRTCFHFFKSELSSDSNFSFLANHSLAKFASTQLIVWKALRFYILVLFTLSSGFSHIHTSELVLWFYTQLILVRNMAFSFVNWLLQAAIMAFESHSCVILVGT